MDKRVNDIEKGLKRLLKVLESSFIATVITDRADNVDVEDMNGTQYPQVRKIATEGTEGIKFKLKQNSFVIVSRLSGSDELYISMMSEIEGISIKVGETTIEVKDNKEISFNGGVNGGIIIKSKLMLEIAKLNTAIQTLRISTASTFEGIVPGLGATYTSATATIQPADLSNVTNEKIKH